MEEVRLQKYMSQAGICSRRKAEQYIEKGLVIVNGKVAKIGQKVIAGKDKVKLKGQAIKEQNELVYYKINKPRGIVTTCADNNDKNIIDIINIKKRVFPIGRLDKESTGLILLTNDGRLGNYLIHPRYEHEKEYIVQVYGPIDDDSLEKVSNGMYILGTRTKKAKVKRLSSGTFSIVLTEGKNRQIRRMVEKVGSQVKKLKRVRIENIEIGNLDEGEYVPLTKREKDVLFERININK